MFCGCFLQIPDISIYIKSPAGKIVFCTQSEFMEFVIKYISNSKCFATVHFLHIGKKWLIFLSWLLGMFMQWSAINTHINICLIGELDLYSPMLKEKGKVWELQFIKQVSISSFWGSSWSLHSGQIMWNKQLEDTLKTVLSLCGSNVFSLTQTKFHQDRNNKSNQPMMS